MNQSIVDCVAICSYRVPPATSTDTLQLELRGKLLLARLCPWRVVEDLKSSGESWNEALLAFQNSNRYTPFARLVIDNISAKFVTRDAARAEQQQRKQQQQQHQPQPQSHNQLDDFIADANDDDDDDDDEDRINIDNVDAESAAAGDNMINEHQQQQQQQLSFVDEIKQYINTPNVAINNQPMLSTLKRFQHNAEVINERLPIDQSIAQYNNIINAHTPATIGTVYDEQQTVIDKTRQKNNNNDDDVIVGDESITVTAIITRDPCNELKLIITNVTTSIDAMRTLAQLYVNSRLIDNIETSHKRIIELIGDEFTLNIEQRRAFEIFGLAVLHRIAFAAVHHYDTSSSSSGPAALKMQLYGAGGTGFFRFIFFFDFSI